MSIFNVHLYGNIYSEIYLRNSKAYGGCFYTDSVFMVWILVLLKKEAQSVPVLCVPTTSLILDRTCPHSTALFWLQRQLINTMLYLSASLRYLYQSKGRNIHEHLGNIRNCILGVTLHMLSQRNRCKLMGWAYKPL